MEIRDLWVAEFSVSQNCGHISQLQDIIAQNMVNVLRKKSNDFVPIHISEYRYDCELVLNKIQQKKPPEKPKG